MNLFFYAGKPFEKKLISSKKIGGLTLDVFCRCLTLLVTFLIMLLGLPLKAQQLQDGDRFYPLPTQGKVRVTDENFQPKFRSLARLRGIHVALDAVKNLAKKQESPFGMDLEGEIRQRLNAVGLKSLNEDEVLITPGQPQMDFFPSFKKEWHGAEDNSGPACCTIGYWAGFSQAGKTMLDPDTHFKIGTWGEPANYHGGDFHPQDPCPDVGPWLSKSVLETLDRFIADYKKGLEEEKKQASERQKPLPSLDYPECNTAIMLYVEVFSTGSTLLGIHQQGIFHQLAEAMGRCNNFRYLIETHADQRGDSAYNLMLSRRRSEAIKNFLLAKGVGKNVGANETR